MIALLLYDSSKQFHGIILRVILENARVGGYAVTGLHNSDFGSVEDFIGE